MQDKLINLLEVKIGAIEKNIDNLNYLNNELARNQEDLEYISDKLDIFNDNNVLEFDKILIDDFKKILNMVDSRGKKIFENKTCNYQGIMYIIKGIRDGISLVLTSEQTDAILNLIELMKVKKDELKNIIKDLLNSKEKLPEVDMDKLELSLNTYKEIISNLNENKYLTEIEEVIDALDFANLTIEEKIDIFAYILKYNRDIYKSNDDTKEEVDDSYNFDEVKVSELAKNDFFNEDDFKLHEVPEILENKSESITNDNFNSNVDEILKKLDEKIKELEEEENNDSNEKENDYKFEDNKVDNDTVNPFDFFNDNVDNENLINNTSEKLENNEFKPLSEDEIFNLDKFQSEKINDLDENLFTEDFTNQTNSKEENKNKEELTNQIDLKDENINPLGNIANNSLNTLGNIANNSLNTLENITNNSLNTLGNTTDNSLNILGNTTDNSLNTLESATNNSLNTIESTANNSLNTIEDFADNNLNQSNDNLIKEELENDLNETDTSLEFLNQDNNVENLNNQSFTENNLIEENNNSLENIKTLLDSYQLLDTFNEYQDIMASITNLDFENLKKCIEIIKNDLSGKGDNFKGIVEVVLKTLPSIFIENKLLTTFINNIDFYKENKINLINLFDNYRELLIIDTNILKRNYEIIKKYELELNNDNIKYLLCNVNLITNLDYYIESIGHEKAFLGKEQVFDGLDYIKKYPYKLNMISRDTLLKLRYSTDNNLRIFGSKPGILAGEVANPKVDILVLPEEYKNSYFNYEYEFIDRSEMTNILKAIKNSIDFNLEMDEYLEKLDNSYKVNNLRYKINNLYFSRIKTIRIYNYLKSKNILTSYALIIALTYQSVITKEEYKSVETLITKLVEGGN